MVDFITRQQAIAISGLTSGSLSRLDNSGVVVPVKMGDGCHPVVLYAQEQVEELTVIAKLKQTLTPYEVKEAIASWRQHGRDKSLLSRFIIVHDGGILWVERSDLSRRIADLIEQNGGVFRFKVCQPIS